MVDPEMWHVCPDCEVPAIRWGLVEINQSNWDVHDGEVVERWRCPECFLQWTRPRDDEEVDSEVESNA